MKKIIFCILFLSYTAVSFATNSVALTTAGVVAYENFFGQTANLTATSSNFTLLTPANEYWYVTTCPTTLSGTGTGMYPQSTNFTYLNAGYRKSITNGGTRCSQYCFVVSNANFWYVGNYGGVYEAGLGSQFYGAGGFANNNISTSQCLAQWTFSTTTFQYVQHIWKPSYSVYNIYNSTGTLIMSWRSYANKIAIPSTTQNLDETFYVPAAGPNGGIYTDFLYYKDVSFTCAGLSSGVQVNLIDSTGVTTMSKVAAGAFLNFDLTEKLMPYKAAFQVIGTNGISIYIDTATNALYGGDLWTFTLDDFAATQTPAPAVSTNTITETITTTFTPTITPTITTTNTKTITGTITETTTETFTPSITFTITATNTKTATNSVTASITQTSTPTQQIRFAYPYTFRLRTLATGTATPIAGAVCWGSTTAAYSATPYLKKKVTDSRGQITWYIFNTGTYYLYKDGYQSCTVGTFTISEATFANFEKGSGVGPVIYTWRLKDSNTGVGLEGISCWITTTNSKTGTMASGRVRTDSHGEIAWKVVSGGTYYVWSELQDAKHTTLTIP